VGVRPVITGVPATGYYVEAVVVDPVAVTVVGNPSALSGIEFVDTQPINIGDATNTQVESVGLAAPAGVSLLQQQPVNVTVRIAALQVAQTVRVPATVTGLGPGLLLQSDVPSVDVTITGPAPTLQNLNPKDFQVVLDLSGLGPGKHVVSPSVTVPKALSLERISPEQITVTLAQPTPTPSPTPTSTPIPTSTPTPGASSALIPVG
jgi:YbbR domain-containing protein